MLRISLDCGGKGSILGGMGSEIAVIKRQECVEALVRLLQLRDL